MTVKLNLTTPSNQQILPPDKLSTMTTGIDKLPDENAAAAAVERLIGEHGENRYQLGAILLKMRSKEWTCGHETFDKLCEHRFGIHRRTADYHIHVFQWVEAAGLTSADVKGVDWAKIRLLAPKIPPDQAHNWIAKAKQVSCRDLGAMLKEAIGGTKPVMDSQVIKLDPEKKGVLDQTLAKIKNDTGVKSDGQALYLMAVAVGSSAVSPTKMAELKDIGEALAPPPEKDAALPTTGLGSEPADPAPWPHEEGRAPSNQGPVPRVVLQRVRSGTAALNLQLTANSQWARAVVQYS